MPNPPEVTAIVVSFNAPDELRRCLRSLLATTGLRLRVIVVDNASTTSNQQLVTSQFPRVELIANATNRGFAAAVNQGLIRSVGDVVLVNPDVGVEPSTLATMHTRLQAHQRVGIVGPRLYYPDGTPQASVKRFPRWIDLALVLSKLPNFFPRLARRYQALDIDYTQEQTVDQVMGACFMIRHQTLTEVGTFDEGFFIWFEEVDYCWRARQRGWSTLYTPAAKASHVRGASFAPQPSQFKQRLLRQSIRFYCRKHFGWLAELGLAPALLISAISGSLIDRFSLRKPPATQDF
ncbi:MAG: glycosyltransferase family 2 protein [Candidatus Kerfeldbacteria bacterium]|nr:glycosyltransferase family 2 protein [Candidatus Kerfeldbacteria bacterium]